MFSAHFFQYFTCVYTTLWTEVGIFYVSPWLMNDQYNASLPAEVDSLFRKVCLWRCFWVVTSVEIQWERSHRYLQFVGTSLRDNDIYQIDLNYKSIIHDGEKEKRKNILIQWKQFLPLLSLSVRIWTKELTDYVVEENNSQYMFIIVVFNHFPRSTICEDTKKDCYIPLPRKEFFPWLRALRRGKG